MEAIKYCDHCGQKIRKLNKHVMDKQKVRMLELLAKARIDGFDWAKVLEGHGVQTEAGTIRGPYRARAHVSRLVWFGLAEHGDVRSGLYRVTLDGMRFLLGEVAVPAAIYCKDGKVVERDERPVFVGQVKGVILDKPYWDNYSHEQKYPRTTRRRDEPDPTPDLFT